MAAKESFIDRWMNELSSDRIEKQENNTILSAKLQEIYGNEILLAKKMEAEAQHLPYPHLSDEALSIVKEKFLQADMLRASIEELGEAVEDSGMHVVPAGEFTDILALESALIEQLGAYSSWAEDDGLDKIAQLLISLRKKHTEHQERIERLIMKINGAL